MAKASREKGKRGEREFAKALTAAGFEARRGVQFAGGQDSPDVACQELVELGYHIEVKRYATCQMFSPAMVAAWVAQAQADAGTRTPIIAHRWDRQREWWVCVCPPGRPYHWQPLSMWLLTLRGAP
ncbi:hypothetical protein ACFP81_10545 [Deinococcus lacus]|uniref:Holliday junction resolvase n=1 Tax=Deinococcus lacus TaxID=392561 RepID=A0ABW1YE47_9DEIO